MKKGYFLIIFLSFIILAACGTKNRSEEIKNYVYQAKSDTLSKEMEAKIGSWINAGTECFGLIVLVDFQGKVLKGLPIKSKVISMRGDSVTLKALETINIAGNMNKKIKGLTKGDIWWETEGELFQTKADAEAYLRKKGWMKKES